MTNERSLRRRVLRLTAFRIGLVSGLLAFGIVVSALYAMPAADFSDDFNVDVSVAGADVSAAGGAALVISHVRGAVAQTCRGRCDDLRFQAFDDENDYVVRVLDAKGACIACDRPRGIMGGFGRWSHRWVVAGEHPLKIIVSDRIGSLPWRAAGAVHAK